MSATTASAARRKSVQVQPTGGGLVDGKVGEGAREDRGANPEGAADDCAATDTVAGSRSSTPAAANTLRFAYSTMGVKSLGSANIDSPRRNASATCPNTLSGRKPSASW